ncbi:hypothetical protein V6N12_065448 [Hibiscus sabdariffa]|uniref:Uncharacterized protein n=1 Tax=Hibiscus sabdariffa TaxID=183260 RepID=A0ABR2G8R3_9ROSI
MQEHIKKQVEQRDYERAHFDHRVHLKELKITEREGQIKYLQKEKAIVERNLKIVEDDFNRVSLELKQKRNMYTTKEVKKQVDEAKKDVKREEVASLRARILDLEE